METGRTSAKSDREKFKTRGTNVLTRHAWLPKENGHVEEEWYYTYMKLEGQAQT